MTVGSRTSFGALLERLPGTRVLVVGEAMVDAYLHGAAERLSRETPVPVVTLHGRCDRPGGAGNVAAAVAALGATPVLLSAVGDDPEAALLRRVLADARVRDVHLVEDRGRRTLVKHRLTAAGQMLVRFDQGSHQPLSRAAERTFAATLQALHLRCDAVIVSDYGAGVMTVGVLEALAALRTPGAPPLTVDARRPGRYRTLHPTLVKPNWSELRELLDLPPGEGPQRAEMVARAGPRILELTGAEVAAVTLDADGAVVLAAGRPPHRTIARPGDDAWATGAGDVWAAACTLALVASAAPPEAADLAAAAAGVALARPGTTTCTAAQLRAALDGPSKRIDDLEGLGLRVRGGHGRPRIIFANGCFDLLHPGHLSLLERARRLGDVLVVGVNADDSVRRLKGPGRPLNGLADRVDVLAALDTVDWVVPFAGDTAVEVIRALRPNVLVKGGDHDRRSLPEAPLVEELGGRVAILPLLPDFSTAGLIERARASR